MKLKKSLYNKILEMFNSGSTIQNISKFCDVTNSSVYDVLLKDKKRIMFKKAKIKHLSFEEDNILRRSIINDLKKINQNRLQEEREKKRISFKKEDNLERFLRNHLKKAKQIESQKRRQYIDKRNMEILGMYKSGNTLEEIGKKFNFTRSRAQQIMVRKLKEEIKERFNLNNLTREEIILLDVAAKEEIQEISTIRKNNESNEIREKLRMKINTLPYTRFVTLSDYAKALGEKMEMIKKYFPEIVKEIVQKQKQLWSRYYNKCRICGTVSVKHVSHGLCENCYPKSDIFKDMQEASRIRNVHKWRKHQREYAKEYKKRPEVILKVRERKFGGNRERALERDGYKCQKCGISRTDSLDKLGKDLYVERIDSRGEFDINNLMSVCKNCHNKRLIQMLHPFAK